jgi:hypothetical protein
MPTMVVNRNVRECSKLDSARAHEKFCLPGIRHRTHNERQGTAPIYRLSAKDHSLLKPLTGSGFPEGMG